MKYHIIAILALILIVAACKKSEKDSILPEEVKVSSAIWDNNEKEITTSYWSEVCEIHIESEGEWEWRNADTVRFEIRKKDLDKWEKKEKYSGTGNAVLELKVSANEMFEDIDAQFIVVFTERRDTLLLTQTASPDMIELIEDEMFRMAVSISTLIYGMDANEDMKVSAAEAEYVPEDAVPYGIDAGNWGVKSIAGIENFPHIRHLDVNTSPDLEEMDLSANKDLMSIHVHGCPKLSKFDISHLDKLIELGCDYSIWLEVEPILKKRKEQIHTLGIFNRKENQASELDLSGFSGLNRLHINDNGLGKINLSGCGSLWRFVASGNNFTELDLSEVDRYYDNYYFMDRCPSLKTIYVWKGWTPDYYTSFVYDEANDIEIIEK